ncbi:DNA mismatch repair protein MSH7 isoform X1 [Selaginella moellendorffii]|uniref:DNA mismatch repair protein MSH7 isoform X1 n=1 Tax=Selaginella moellendorffii TaxID=88036 RepID=UPI000D1CABE0|nr:DNA mismatch repair protein MSH7 isoform X1 [Selaginella moellendorffii]|eukprot:XP_024516949.1 DNA mismatch repair protein MSH7 isoform X1 [Selaginella moellendorffii]
MSRQRSLLAFYDKDTSRKQGRPRRLDNPIELGDSQVDQLIESITHKMRKPVPTSDKRLEVPLVPGTKRVRDDFSRETFDESKRKKLLEALGDDEGSKQGAWAEAQAKFEWMQPSNIRDGNGRNHSDPLFDVRTVHIPENVLKKMSASQRQYWTTKCHYMDIVLFFKVGKFYELYELDAEIGHKELDWKMTISGVGKCRQVGVPESGIEDAVQKLVARGYKVGRMEQVETSEQAKAKRGPNAMVERKLVQVVTPSTLTDGIMKPEAIHLLAVKEENSGPSAVIYGFAFADAAGGLCYVGSFCDNDAYSALDALVMQIAPQEVLYEIGGLSPSALKVFQRYIRPGSLPLVLTPLQPGADFPEPATVLELISSRGYFQECVKCSGQQPGFPGVLDTVDHKDAAMTALGALVSHLHRIKMDAEIYNGVLCAYELYWGFMRLDGQTIANLELLANTANGGKAGSLMGYLDSCATAFAKRLLRRWICHPLQDTKAINHRLDSVEELLCNPECAAELRALLRKVPDLERLSARLRGFSDSSFAEVLLPLAKQAFQRRLKTLCLAVSGLLRAYQVLECLRQMPAKARLLRRACKLLKVKSSIECLWSMEPKLDMEKQSLNTDQDEDEETQRKTLSWMILEFNKHQRHWTAIVDALSYIDVLISFAAAKRAAEGPTCRPTFVAADQGVAVLEMQGLWHPFAAAGMGGTFVPNDIALGLGKPRAILLTGPNMGGKSTLLRATCVATLMAQLGCYVPSESCTLSLVDTIFTRIGARDRIMSGESTFMVECAEAGSILCNATSNSLVVLDELGRGTSTFDGYAIAYAVFRHLVEAVGCRLVFATHYHPLTQEFSGHPSVSLQHMACSFDSSSSDRQLAFLYKLRAGASSASYGLQVALLAGIPASVVDAARGASELIAPRLRGFSSSGMLNCWLRRVCSMAMDSGSIAGAQEDYKSLLGLWSELQTAL